MTYKASDSALDSGVAHHELQILVLFKELVHVDEVLKLTKSLNKVEFFHESGVSETIKVGWAVDSSNSCAKEC